MKPDVIVTWPNSADYPLWRQFIRDNRARLNEVIVVFMETNTGRDCREFVKNAMFEDHVLFVDSPMVQHGDDWRDLAVKAGLAQSLHSEWIWFTEQDFFPKDGDFWAQIEKAATTDKVGVIGIMQGDRLHPACLLMKREVLNKTRKRFGIVPDKYDHFYLIQQDIEGMRSSLELHIALLNNDLFMHLNGLTSNMSLLERQQAPNWNVEEFKNYLRGCLKVSVPLDKWFTELVCGYLGEQLPVQSPQSSL